MRAVTPTVIVAMALTACATPARTERDLRANWIGKTIEAFVASNIRVGEHAYMRPPESIEGGKLLYVYNASERLTLFGWYGPIVMDADCTIHFMASAEDHAIEEIEIVRSFPGSVADTYCSNKVR